jgi:hypothetical protein
MKAENISAAAADAANPGVTKTSGVMNKIYSSPRRSLSSGHLLHLANLEMA